MTPTLAERARGVLASASTIEIGVLSMTVALSRHVSDADGSLLFCAPPAGGATDASTCPMAMAGRLPSPVLVATATDVSPVAQPDRVRGRVRLTGTVATANGPGDPPLPDEVAEHLGAHPARPVLRLHPQRVALDWRVARGRDAEREPGFVPVDPTAYAAARLDPLLGWEASWCEHLARDHAEVADALARSAAPALEPGAVVRPLMVDRAGITLRVYEGARPTGARADIRGGPGQIGSRSEGVDVVLPLGREVQCGCDARAALDDLVRTRLGSPGGC